MWGRDSSTIKICALKANKSSEEPPCKPISEALTTLDPSPWRPNNWA